MQMVGNKPLEVFTLYLTGKCNLECSYCYEQKFDLPTDMCEEQLKEIIYNIYRYHNPYAIVLFGGEPALRWDLIRCYIKEKSNYNDTEVLSVLFTNGLPLTEMRLLELKAGGVKIHLSFDGLKLSSSLRYGRYLDKYITKIIDLLVCCKKNKLDMAIVITVGEHNISSIFNDIKELHFQYGISEFRFNILRKKRFCAAQNELVETRNKVMDWGKDNNVVIEWDYPNKFGSTFNNWYISSNNIRYLKAGNKGDWELVKW